MIKIADYLKLYLLQNERQAIWASRHFQSGRQPLCLWDTRGSGDNGFRFEIKAYGVDGISDFYMYGNEKSVGTRNEEGVRTIVDNGKPDKGKANDKQEKEGKSKKTGGYWKNGKVHTGGSPFR